jgi:hypothetical protein
MTSAHRRIPQVRVLTVPLGALRVPHSEYSEYPTAGAPAPTPPTVEALNDTSAPPHTAGASTHSTLVSTCEYSQ